MTKDTRLINALRIEFSAWETLLPRLSETQLSAPLTPGSLSLKDTLAHLHDDPSQLDPVAWNALLDAQAAPTPFMRHEFLAAQERHGCVPSEQGEAERDVGPQRGGFDPLQRQHVYIV